MHQLITYFTPFSTLVDLLVLALIQFATLTGTPNNIGSTGWDHDYTGSTPTTIGSTGWDHDYTGSTPTTIGSTGWDHDYTGSPTPADPTIGSTGWDHD